MSEFNYFFSGQMRKDIKQILLEVERASVERQTIINMLNGVINTMATTQDLDTAIANEASLEQNSLSAVITSLSNVATDLGTQITALQGKVSPDLSTEVTAVNKNASTLQAGLDALNQVLSSLNTSDTAAGGSVGGSAGVGTASGATGTTTDTGVSSGNIIRNPDGPIDATAPSADVTSSNRT